ncbi:MAG: adenylyltransferase/cytidyltransferase family protein [Candidatus Bathyarchaeia archaeon]
MSERKRVLASGVFDLIHYGHLRFLEEAKRLGGKGAELIVVVARDSTVRRLKGQDPILPEDERLAIVEGLKPVDKAFLGHEELNISEVIETYKPDIIALGYDQHEIAGKVRAAIEEGGYRIKVVTIPKFGRGDLNSSSKIKRRIIDNLR